MKSFDLTAVARATRGRKTYERFQGLVRDCSEFRSAITDLKDARAHLDLAWRVWNDETPVVAERPQDETQSLLMGGLFTKSLILFCRALEGKPAILDRAPTMAPAYHRLKQVRDKGVAHTEPGHALVDGPWSEDRLLLGVVGDMGTIGSLNERANYRANVWEDLDEAIELGRSGCAEILDEFDLQLLEEINRFDLATGGSLSRRIAKHPHEGEIPLGRKTRLVPTVRRA